MKWKFLREHHNRQEKAWKGSGACPGSASGEGKPSRVWEEEFYLDWSTSPPRIYSLFRYNRVIDKAMHKAEISKRFTAMLHSTRFIVEGYKFRFTYTLAQFARANRLSLRDAGVIFPNVSESAEGKRQIVMRRFLRAPVKFSLEQTPGEKDYREVATVRFQWTDILMPDVA